MMAHSICPVCGVEVAGAHNCMEYLLSDFSLEEELLGLPFGLEPYGPVDEKYSPLYVAESIDDYPSKVKNSDDDSEAYPLRFARDTLSTLTLRNKAVPMFLRL